LRFRRCAPDGPQDNYCRSDYSMHARYAKPVAFTPTSYHPDYHMVTDEPEYIDYQLLARNASFVWLLIHLPM